MLHILTIKLIVHGSLYSLEWFNVLHNFCYLFSHISWKHFWCKVPPPSACYIINSLHCWKWGIWHSSCVLSISNKFYNSPETRGITNGGLGESCPKYNHHPPPLGNSAIFLSCPPPPLAGLKIMGDFGQKLNQISDHAGLDMWELSRLMLINMDMKYHTQVSIQNKTFLCLSF